MTRRLIVCCDGTWNSEENKDKGSLAPTNVFRLFNALCCDDTQLTRYQTGVGSGGVVDKILGGSLGLGLSEDIRDCYQWLATNYRQGDEIFLFGFSRGAFTARSLGGMIGRFGIVRFAPQESMSAVVQRIYRKGYRHGQTLEDLNFHPDSRGIRFIGVWDTVGALGIPDDKALLNLLDNPDNYRFHDVKLGAHVKTARHAVAIDEQRGSFTPTLWEAAPERDLVQLWFAGVHSDVGGGYKEHGLADVTLKWMMDEAKKCDLRFKESALKQIHPNPLDQLHESHVGLMKLLLTTPRSLPVLSSSAIHDSVQRRREAPPIDQMDYLPTREWSAEGRITLDIYARHPWFWTGIYLETGRRYRFEAQGEWMDSTIPAGPEGVHDKAFVHVMASALGKVETWYGQVSGNTQANFVMTKRLEEANWFTLIGALANGGNPKPDGTPEPSSTFIIGKGTELGVQKGGYLYCFANDAWGFYDNNRGYVTLTVTQLA